MSSRWTAFLGTALIASGLAVSMWPIPADADVTITGSGTWSIEELLVPWRTDLYEARVRLDLDYTSTGTFSGLDQLARGQVDYAVTAAEPQPGQLTKDPAKRYLRAPIRVDAQALVAVFGPDTLTTITPPADEDGEAVLAPYEGPMRLTPEGVARAFSFTPGTGTIWGLNPNFPSQWVLDVPDGSFINPGGGAETAVVRSDASSSNLYLERYIRTLAPTTWATHARATGVGGVEPSPIWPFPNEPARRGSAGGQLAVLRARENPNDPGRIKQTQGVFALVPISAAMVELQENQLQRAAEVPGARRTGDFRIIELRNGAGEWVTPTEQSILTAIEAGGGAPLHGLAEPVSGAWPLAHLDHLYAPAQGLAPEKANGVAALIRYAVTRGQDHVQPLGTPRLPERYVREALDVANEVVTGNCTAPGYELVEGAGAGALLPGDLLVPGPIRQCLRPSGPTAADWPEPEIVVDDSPPAETTVPSTTLPATTTTSTTVASSPPPPPQAPRAAPAPAAPAQPPQTASAPRPVTATTVAVTTTTVRSPPPSPQAEGAPVSSSAPATAGSSAPLVVDNDLAAAGEDAAAVPEELPFALPLPLPLPESERSGQHRVATLFMGAGLVTLGNGRWRRHVKLKASG